MAMRWINSTRWALLSLNIEKQLMCLLRTTYLQNWNIRQSVVIDRLTLPCISKIENNIMYTNNINLVFMYLFFNKLDYN